jgi:ankyrin repeat protein
VLKYLVECGVDIVSLCPTILHYADDLHTMKYLVQCGAILCTDENGQTPLHKARQPAIISYLVEIGADVNAGDYAGRTPLHCTRTIDGAKSLIAHKADVNARDNDGMTPLHTALSAKSVQLLIDHKADVSALDNTGKTPLHYQKDSGAVEALMKNGADVDAADEEGRTPLMTAVPDNTYYARILLGNGVNLNTMDSKGWTVLHHITSTGTRMSTNTLSTLIERKADPNIRDNDGKTPLDLATDWDVISELKRAGARR